MGPLKAKAWRESGKLEERADPITGSKEDHMKEWKLFFHSGKDTAHNTLNTKNPNGLTLRIALQACIPQNMHEPQPGPKRYDIANRTSSLHSPPRMARRSSSRMAPRSFMSPRAQRRPSCLSLTLLWGVVFERLGGH